MYRLRPLSSRDNHAEGLAANAQPRQVGELLDMADLYYHYHGLT